MSTSMAADRVLVRRGGTGGEVRGRRRWTRSRSRAWGACTRTWGGVGGDETAVVVVVGGKWGVVDRPRRGGRGEQRRTGSERYVLMMEQQ